MEAQNNYDEVESYGAVKEEETPNNREEGAPVESKPNREGPKRRRVRLRMKVKMMTSRRIGMDMVLMLSPSQSQC